MKPLPRAFTLAVAAGKGGTGKTLLSTSLAWALANAAAQPVQLVDCDVEEPNADLLLHPQVQQQRSVTVPIPHIQEECCSGCGRCAAVCRFSALARIRDKIAFFPALCIGCGACSYVCPEQAITEEQREIGALSLGSGPGGMAFAQGRVHVGEQRVTPLLHALRQQLQPDGVRILDAPPGTACPMQETVAASDCCLLVTEPTPFGRSDLEAAVETCRALEVPCAVVVNRAGIGDRSVHEYCSRAGLPIMLEIPWQRAIASAYAAGKTLPEADPRWQAALLDLYRQLVALASAEEKDAA